MENINDTSIFEFNIDEESKTQLSGIAQWAKINAIVAFVSMGVTVLSTILTLAKISAYSGAAAGANVFGTFITVAVSLLLNITLLAAASNLKKGVEQTDQGHFGLGLSKMAAYFKILGILMIIAITVIVLALIVIMMIGAGRGFR